MRGEASLRDVWVGVWRMRDWPLLRVIIVGHCVKVERGAVHLCCCWLVYAIQDYLYNI